jgi:sulfite exporter TauE/SafE
MTEFQLLFLAGLAGSLHCVGMCGGFACVIGADARGRAATLRRQLAYNVGRVTTYCFLGALAGYLGLLLVAHSGDAAIAAWIQRGFALLSGVLLVYVGLQFFGLQARGALGAGGALLADAMRSLVRAPGLAGPLAFGVLNGFLPCPLVYAAAAQAAASGGPGPGMLTMAAFGLGTFPALLAAGALGAWWQRAGAPAGVATLSLASRGSAARAAHAGAGRARTLRLAGALIVALGLVTLARGLLPLSGHVH